MRRIIAVLCIILVLSLPAVAAEPTAALLQEKPVAALPTTPISSTLLKTFGQVAAVIGAIMASNMDPAAKERVTLATIELGKYDIETTAKTKESLFSKIFDISVKLISLAASVFAVVKITT